MNFQSGMVCVGLGYPQMILAEQDWPGQSRYDQHRKDGMVAIFPNYWNLHETYSIEL